MNTAIWPSRFGSALAAAFSTLGRRAGSFFTSGALAGASTTVLGAAGLSLAFGSSTVAALGVSLGASIFTSSDLASTALSAAFTLSLAVVTEAGASVCSTGLSALSAVWLAGALI